MSWDVMATDLAEGQPMTIEQYNELFAGSDERNYSLSGSTSWHTTTEGSAISVNVMDNLFNAVKSLVGTTGIWKLLEDYEDNETWTLKILTTATESLPTYFTNVYTEADVTDFGLIYQGYCATVNYANDVKSILDLLYISYPSCTQTNTVRYKISDGFTTIADSWADVDSSSWINSSGSVGVLSDSASGKSIFRDTIGWPYPYYSTIDQSAASSKITLYPVVTGHEDVTSGYTTTLYVRLITTGYITSGASSYAMDENGEHTIRVGTSTPTYNILFMRSYGSSVATITNSSGVKNDGTELIELTDGLPLDPGEIGYVMVVPMGMDATTACDMETYDAIAEEINECTYWTNSTAGINSPWVKWSFNYLTEE